MKFSEPIICPKCGWNSIKDEPILKYLSPEQAQAPSDKLNLSCGRCGYQWVVDPLDAPQA